LRQALCLLRDPELAAATAPARPSAGPDRARDGGFRARRRLLLRGLRDRHPQALAGILEALGQPRPGERTIVVQAFIWLIIITIGIDGAGEHPFSDLDGP
jgi:hypothetical protein